MPGQHFLRPGPAEPPYLNGIEEFIRGSGNDIVVKAGDSVSLLFPMKQVYMQMVGDTSLGLPKSAAEPNTLYKLVEVFAGHATIVDSGTPLMAFRKLTAAEAARHMGATK